jgi:hypothetical protein
VALRRHLSGAPRSPHDLAIDAERFTFDPDAEKIHFERGAGCGGYASGGVPVTGAFPDFGQSRSAGLRPPKWHFAGTRPARHDPRTISQLMQKRFTFVNVAPAIWRWRWHWRWCCRPQQRSERGPGEARAQLCELHGRSRPPDCCPGSPWPTQIAQRSRCPSPQPKATSQGSTAHPGRDGPGAAWEERGVVHGV